MAHARVDEDGKRTVDEMTRLKRDTIDIMTRAHGHIKRPDGLMAPPFNRKGPWTKDDNERAEQLLGALGLTGKIGHE